MPTNLSLAAVLEKNRLSSDVAIIALLDVDIVDPATGVVSQSLHVANNPEDIVFNGVTYTKGGFDFQVKQESGSMPDVSISVNDFTQALQYYLQLYGGMVGSNVTLSIVRADALSSPPEIMEYFQVIGASAADYTVTFSLGAENSVMQTFPRRRQYRDFCQYAYKGAECGYTGAMASCDYTLQGANGCAAHGNSARFGGFPGLNVKYNRYY